VYRRKDGRWVIDIQVKQVGETIRIKRAARAKNKTEALEREAEERARLMSGAAAKPKAAPAFSAFVAEFLGFAATNNKPSEIASKEMITRVHLLPFFGPTKLGDISAREVERYKATKLGEKLNAKTVNNHLTVLRRMLSLAHEWEMIKSVPKLKWLKIEDEDPKFLDFEDADRLLLAAGAWRPMILFAMRTGLRQGELLALRWDDVDLAKGQVNVRRSAFRGEVGTLKTKASKRSVPLSPDTLSALGALPSRFAGKEVFTDGEGKALTKGACKWPLWSACRHAGLPRLGWHALRHTFASHLVMRGVPLRTVQEFMGHTTMAMTTRYAHLAPDHTRSAIALLDSRGTVAERSASETA